MPNIYFPRAKYMRKAPMRKMAWKIGRVNVGGNIKTLLRAGIKNGKSVDTILESIADQGGWCQQWQIIEALKSIIDDGVHKQTHVTKYVKPKEKETRTQSTQTNPPPQRSQSEPGFGMKLAMINIQDMLKEKEELEKSIDNKLTILKKLKKDLLYDITTI